MDSKPSREEGTAGERAGSISSLAHEPARFDHDELANAALLGSARHELRSPLQSLLGFAELLESETYGPLTPAQHSFVGHLRTAAGELSVTIEACADVVRAMNEPLPSNFETLLLAPVLEGAFRQARAVLPCKLVVREVAEPGITIRATEAAFSRALSAVLSAVAALTRDTMTASVCSSHAASPTGTGVAEPPPPLSELQIEVRSDRAPIETEAFIDVDELAREGRSSRALLWLKLAALTVAPHGGQVRTTRSTFQVCLTFPRIS